MEDGQHHFRGGLATRMAVHWNAAAVVDDCNRAIDVNRDVDLVAVASKCLVNRVVDNLVHQMVQAWRTSRSDVHRGPLPYSLQPLEDLDFVGTVIVSGPVAVRPVRSGALRHYEVVDVLVVLVSRLFHTRF